MSSGLAGQVQTRPGNTRGNCRKLVAGDPVYTFGLTDYRDATVEEVETVIRKLCGDAALDGDPEGRGFIDPDTTLAGIARHRELLADCVRSPGRALLATGHPTGLLAHYQAIARHLAAAGWELLTPRDDEVLPTKVGPCGVRFLGGVACAWRGGELLHRHRSDLMESMLATGPEPDLVVGDHGMAGAAIERGIRTLSVADVNDPALPLAQSRGRTDGVLIIDDNLAPTRFEPVTAAILGT